MNKKNIDIKKTLLDNGIIIVLLLLVLITGITKDNFFSWNNLSNISVNTAARVIIAFGVSGCLITKGTDLSAGRMVGLASCIAGLLQLIAIFGSALLFYNINKSAWGDNWIIESMFNIPVNLFVYMLVFFILGFLIYAFLYGAIGSTASKLEDINTSVMPITFLFIIAFFVVIFSMQNGNVDNILMRVCSYIPFTSPMAMFTRICMSTVAWYEIAISITILIGSTVGIGLLSAKIYRVGVLLYGTPPKISSIIRSMLH